MTANLVHDRVGVNELEVLRALADPLRWQIVGLLAVEQLCVCHLTEELGVAQPLVSHHLKALRDAGLVESERFRYWSYYRLRPEVLDELAGHLGALAVDAPAASRARRPCC
jgi:ArsR family transcriptional regulator